MPLESLAARKPTSIRIGLTYELRLVVLLLAIAVAELLAVTAARFHLGATVAWLVIGGAITWRYPDAIWWVAAMSLYANVVGHWSAYQAAKADQHAQQQAPPPGPDVRRPVSLPRSTVHVEVAAIPRDWRYVRFEFFPSAGDDDTTVVMHNSETGEARPVPRKHWRVE